MSAVAQSTVSMTDFARAMREAGGSFAEGVARFESRFGKADEGLLAVLAQAALLCWHNVEAQRNLFAVCKAIRTGKPTLQYYHCQVTAERWDEMHTYLVGVQRWLGLDRPLPPQVDALKVGEIGRWLGDRTPAKEALAELFLMRLVDDLLSYVSLAALGPGTAGEQVYSDYSRWYLNRDGTPYAVPRRGDTSRQPFADPSLGERVDQLEEIVCEGLSSSPSDAEELVSRLKRQTQPPCMHRVSRYLDVQITSIGALKWRGNLPLDARPRAAWQAFVEQAHGALQVWADGLPADGEMAERIHAALGAPSEPKRAVVRDFLLAGFWDVGDRAAWDWLVLGAQATGSNAYSAFHLQGAFPSQDPSTRDDGGD